MKISLIILNYNSYNDTIKCVSQLQSFSEKYHIVIVDNCSTDDSYEILSKKYENSEIDVIKTAVNGGYSAGNNYGIKFAVEKYGVDVVGILNPDVIIPKAEVIEEMYLSLLKDEKNAIVGACAIGADHKFNVRASAWNLPSTKRLITDYLLCTNRNNQAVTFEMISDNVAKVECVAGCFFLAKVKILQEIGYLDESVFLYNEENLLGYKIKEKGYRVIIQLNQFYYHMHDYTRKKMTLKNKLMTQKHPYESRKYLCKKYYPAYLVFFLKVALIINLVQIFLGYCKNAIKKGN